LLFLCSFGDFFFADFLGGGFVLDFLGVGCFGFGVSVWFWFLVWLFVTSGLVLI